MPIRYLNLECPKSSPINQRFSFHVQFLIELQEEAIQTEEIGNIEISESIPEVEIVLRAQSFDIQNTNTSTIQIQLDEDTEKRFVLIPLQLGEQQIRVDVYQHGQKVITAQDSITITGGTETGYTEFVSPSQVKTTLELSNQFLVSPPDLELTIELNQNDNRTLYFTLNSKNPYIDCHHRSIGQVTLHDSPEAKIQDVYERLGQLASNYSCNSKEARRELENVGNDLWRELIPENLKRKYWELPPDIHSLLITSDEPWIPWEIVKPFKFKNNGGVEQYPFWCEKFAMSRWLSGPGTVEKLPAKLVIPVAPTKTNLPCVEDEITFLQNLENLRLGISSIPPICSVSELDNYIQEPKFSILHFACHGMFDNTSPNYSTISLNDGSLRPSDIRLNFSNIYLRPLIFINACHSGRSGFSFTKIGGWAERFVNSRVGVFIGTMWEVSDEHALRFAKTFYTALLSENLTVSQAFLRSRLTIREEAPHNSTWLAYSLYADPEARIAEPGIKDLLAQLQQAIDDPNLSDDDKKQTLEQLDALAVAGQNPQEQTMQKKAKRTVGFLKVIAEGVEPTTKLAQAFTSVLPKILLFFGL